MLDFYGKWMDRWERKLATRDTNRVVRPFEWGLDWLSATGISGSSLLANANGDASARLRDFITRAVADSDPFFSYEPAKDFQLNGNHLTFTSPVVSPYPVNNTAHAEFFPAGADGDRAVLVLPQWNSDARGHLGLCKLLNRFGLTALRMSLAYHDKRMPEHLERADYHLSSNIGRTIHATRQSVIDVRTCLDWLESRGYSRLAILGTSLGSCIAFITAAHDLRVRAAVFNHVSLYCADVVWTGLSTQHVRKGFGTEVTQDDLRHYWSIISPAAYLDRIRERDLKSLLVWATHDSTFLPVYSRQVLEFFRTEKLPHEVFNLPCGHYTTGQFPFNLMDGLRMCRFLAKNL